MQEYPHASGDEITPGVGLLILGFGGHARSVADVALAAGVTDFYFVDKNARSGESFLGFPVVAQRPDTLPEGWSAFPGSGDNAMREKQSNLLEELEWPIATVISPTASVGVGSNIGLGSFIAHHAHIGPMAKIGAACIVNTAAVIEHECQIGNFTHISVNATIAGCSQIGHSAMIGAGATIIDNVQIADNITIGAGGVVKDSLVERGVYVGVPVKPVHSSKVSE